MDESGRVAVKARLVVNDARSNALDFADRLRSRMDDEGVSLSEGACDVVIAVGGDGTVLEALRLGLEMDCPVLGFNLGTVGFLAESEPGEMPRAVSDLVAGRFRVERRATLEAEMGAHRVVGVNDVVVEKIHSQRLVVLDVLVDSSPFLTYRCDGIVVATSTGSTAYTFSAGGPLVDPEIDTVLVTPIASHSLFNRTVVLGPSATISVRVAAARPTRVSVDGVELGTLSEDEVVTIRRGSSDARFVRFDRETFPERLTRKFGLD